MRLRAGAASDTGKVRSLNEDWYQSVPDAGLFVVCDGLGGFSAGEVASRLAAASIVEYVTGEQTSLDLSVEPPRGLRARTAQLAAAVRYANAAVFAQAQSDAEQAGMGTTVVGVWMDEQVACIAHVGDSRAYLWHGGELEPLTRDHSLVEEQVQAGLLSRADSLHAAHQNVLLRALGREADVEVEVNEVPVEPGDRLVLCTDGLTRMVADAEIGRAVAATRDPQAACDALVARANANGGLDNVTVLVVDVGANGLAQAWTRLTTG